MCKKWKSFAVTWTIRAVNFNFNAIGYVCASFPHQLTWMEESGWCRSRKKCECFRNNSTAAFYFYSIFNIIHFKRYRHSAAVVSIHKLHIIHFSCYRKIYNMYVYMSRSHNPNANCRLNVQCQSETRFKRIKNVRAKALFSIFFPS